jgi:hypothetical protein
MKEKIAQFIGVKKPYNFVRLIIFIFACSRAVLYYFVPFVIEQEIALELHLLDPVTLKDNLLHGLWSLHAQPPLFNVFVGIMLKLNPYISMHITFPVLYFCLGLFICLGSYFLLKILGASSRMAFVGSLAVMFFPPLVQSERWMHPSYPLAALILGGAFLAYYFVKKRSFKFFAWFFALMSVLVLTRGVFHLLLWLLPLMVLAAVLIYKLKLPKKRYYILVMAVFFLLSGSIYVKNYVQYGMFTSSTWQGMNIAVTTHYVKESDIQKLVNEKIITPLALIPRLSDPLVYNEYYHLPLKTGNEDLDSLKKSTGYPNYNNWIYPVASKEYQSNTLKILVRHPVQYLMSVANEVYVFFGFFQYREFDNFRNWGSARVHTRLDKILFDITAYPLPLFMAVLFASVIYWLLKKLKSGVNFSQAGPEKQAEYTLIIFIFFALVYTFCLAISASAGEANFLRIPIDPLFVSLAVLSAGGWLAAKFKWLKFLK